MVFRNSLTHADDSAHLFAVERLAWELTSYHAKLIGGVCNNVHPVPALLVESTAAAHSISRLEPENRFEGQATAPPKRIPV